MMTRPGPVAAAVAVVLTLAACDSGPPQAGAGGAVPPGAALAPEAALPPGRFSMSFRGETITLPTGEAGGIALGGDGSPRLLVDQGYLEIVTGERTGERTVELDMVASWTGGYRDGVAPDSLDGGAFVEIPGVRVSSWTIVGPPQAFALTVADLTPNPRPDARQVTVRARVTLCRTAEAGPSDECAPADVLIETPAIFVGG